MITQVINFTSVTYHRRQNEAGYRPSFNTYPQKKPTLPPILTQCPLARKLKILEQLVFANGLEISPT